MDARRHGQHAHLTPVQQGRRARHAQAPVGGIINLTSGSIYAAVGFRAHYVASMGAIAEMTRALAKELGSDAITVNAIAPGLTITQGIESNVGYSETVRAQQVAARCIPREERAEDVVGTCAFLASEAASFITGQILVVDVGSVFP